MKAKKVLQVKTKGKARGGSHTFTGKMQYTAEGLKAINRSFTDKKAWEDRRKKEQPPPGGWAKPPAHWPPGVRVSIGRPVWWLPKGWGQGVKTTCAAWLGCFISPEGKMYYHKHVVEQIVGKKFTKPPTARQDHVEWATKRARIAIAEGKTFRRTLPKVSADDRLFANLSAAERRHLPAVKDLHFAVVSARRAKNEQGLRNICAVQAQLVSSGADPMWYVDDASLQDYKGLGLKAKVGGKLVPARNLALKDAAKLGKLCVQVSDDISGWDFYKGDLGQAGDLQSGNAAAKVADHMRASPVAAARFLAAKMRAAAEANKAKASSAAAAKKVGPKLAGLFPLGNTGQAFTRAAVSKDLFILGDFFVAEPSSTVRFDTKMVLKEDYDFTCSHLDKYGEVLRCNRMFIRVVHETNAGGACSERDDAGDRERAMIRVLREKWPGVFWVNGNRGDTQVVMSWKRRRVE